MLSYIPGLGQDAMRPLTNFLKKLIVYLPDSKLVEMIDQLSTKYLLKNLAIYLDFDHLKDVELHSRVGSKCHETIDQFSQEISGLPLWFQAVEWLISYQPNTCWRN